MSKALVKKKSFKNDLTALPVTMEQFQDLTNEVLTALNEISAPLALDADYVAQILMSAIHAMKHEFGYAKKSDLFESCVNRISCHVTYHVVEEIQNKLKAKAAADAPKTETVETPDGNLTDNVTPLVQEAVATTH